MNKLFSIVLSILGFINIAAAQNAALNFDGKDDFIEISGEVGNFDFNQDFTISVWVKPDPIQADLLYEDNEILEKWSQDGPYPFAIRYLNKKAGKDEGKILALRYDGSQPTKEFPNETGGGHFPSLTSSVKVNDGKWHHIIFMKSKSTLTLYIDGEISALTIDNTTKTTKNDSHLYIGRRGNGINHFKGEIDEVRIWNIGLANSIETINRITPNQNGLVAAYNFNEGKANSNNLSINLVNDHLGNNQGILQNFKRIGDNSNYVLSGAKLTEDKPNNIAKNDRTAQSIENIGSEPIALTNERRVALVIGNAAYPGVAQLRNPVNDAKLIAEELKNLGFEVTKIENGNRIEIINAIGNLGRELAKDKNTTGLFYYAGHGMQVKGTNYIIPVDAKIDQEADAKAYCIDLDDGLISYFEDSGNKTNLIILDACRNNPFGRSFRSSKGNGLATVVNQPKGTYIAFATAPGTVAADGDGANGLYTQEFVKALQIPKLKIEDVFKRVRANVSEKSDDKQIPWDNSSLIGDFYFKRQ